MTVLFKCPELSLLDDLSYYGKVYKDIGKNYDTNFYTINGPFMMDSQFEAEKRLERRIRKRKERKRKTSNHHLNQTVSLISSLLPRVMETSEEIGMKKSCLVKDNNKEAREKAKSVNNIPCSMEHIPCSMERGSTSDGTSEVILLKHDECFCLEKGNFYKNDCEKSIICHVLGTGGLTSVCVPSGSLFTIDDVTAVNNESFDCCFDVLIIDPPWINRSAKRLKSYELSDDVLYNINIDKLLKPSGILCLWITNRTGIMEEVDEFLSKRQLKRVVIWHWLKVTLEMEPVCPFNSDHKLPFESLVVACRINCYEWDKVIPDQHVLVSVPMSVPSHKPLIIPLLREFGVEIDRICELFARNLLPNTTSIGLEPLLLQNIDLFHTTDVEDG